ncbi:MAG TPA: hypothetical protein H9771_06695, partial [Candidatus Faecalibacterium faecipullorum]|nr:hypothetical protein [Candidatus Faecalibacterium faecipullorum]
MTFAPAAPTRRQGLSAHLSSAKTPHGLRMKRQENFRKENIIIRAAAFFTSQAYFSGMLFQSVQSNTA